MAGKGCCGDNRLPKVLTDTTLVSPRLVDAKIGEKQGGEVYAGDCLATCADIEALQGSVNGLTVYWQARTSTTTQANSIGRKKTYASLN